ncbi:pirin family protein [Namhaeicola litoreus]|uniref:Pirin family protein n=1 Tax=Namhaeicola litoreus TaxID=1052145 RepID=A0ABW3Y4G0_9FLAO
MNIKLYPAAERGYANFDWLQANYSFSFANYYNPNKLNFGALRVLNDDIIQGGAGFGMHPHNNMEIITIPLEGSLKHKDNMSDQWIELKPGEVQVMSAGTGVVHSEKNGSAADFLSLFQIWIIPNRENVEPGYGQIEFSESDRKNKLQKLVVSHDNKEFESAKNILKIHQDAIISRIDLDKGKSFTYKSMTKEHGVYMMLIDGELNIQDSVFNRRDAAGITNANEFSIEAKKNSQILFIEVPMLS